MKGYSFSVQRLTLLLHPFFGLVRFWFSFMGSLAGCEVLLHFLACRRSREDGSPFAVTVSHVAMLSYQSGLVKVWAPDLFLHHVNDELIMYEWIALVFKREKVSEGGMKWNEEGYKHLIIKREMRVFTLN